MRAMMIIMLFAILSIADASAGENDWNDEKAKSLGFQLVPIGTVVMCETEQSVGFKWENGTKICGVGKSFYVF